MASHIEQLLTRAAAAAAISHAAVKSRQHRRPYRVDVAYTSYSSPQWRNTRKEKRHSPRTSTSPEITIAITERCPRLGYNKVRF